jgi:hypothetical protein
MRSRINGAKVSVSCCDESFDHFLSCGERKGQPKTRLVSVQTQPYRILEFTLLIATTP